MPPVWANTGVNDKLYTIHLQDMTHLIGPQCSFCEPLSTNGVAELQCVLKCQIASLTIGWGGMCSIP